MTQAIRMLISNALSAEFRAFEELLQSCPAEQVAERPSYGHTVAWHALHIMDWTRCMIQPGLNGVNPALTYGHLGVEDQPWAQAVTGPTLAQEQDRKEVILAAVQMTFAQALAAIQSAPDERFSSDAVWGAIKKPRPVLESLMYHATHTAYHRGQARQVINEVDALTLQMKSPKKFIFSGRNSRLKTKGGPSGAEVSCEGRDH